MGVVRLRGVAVCGEASMPVPRGAGAVSSGVTRRGDAPAPRTARGVVAGCFAGLIANEVVRLRMSQKILGARSRAKCAENANESHIFQIVFNMPTKLGFNFREKTENCCTGG